jgi:hypothetical protein
MDDFHQYQWMLWCRSSQLRMTSTKMLWGCWREYISPMWAWWVSCLVKVQLLTLWLPIFCGISGTKGTGEFSSIRALSVLVLLTELELMSPSFVPHLGLNIVLFLLFWAKVAACRCRNVVVSPFLMHKSRTPDVQVKTQSSVTCKLLLNGQSSDPVVVVPGWFSILLFTSNTTTLG